MSFVPSRSQKEAKAKLLHKTDGNIMVGSLESLSNAQLSKYAGINTIDHWVEQEGFKDWFLDKDSNDHLIQSAADSAIRAAIAILEDPEVGQKGKPGYKDQLAAAKMLLEFAGYAPVKKKEVTNKEDPTANMSAEDMDKAIAQYAAETEQMKQDLALVGPASEDNTEIN